MDFLVYLDVCEDAHEDNVNLGSSPFIQGKRPKKINVTHWWHRILLKF